MRYYEILYIVNPNFERKKLDDTMKEIDNRLTKTKSNTNSEYQLYIIRNIILWPKKIPSL